MNYTLHQLQILVEVVRLKSITKAAAELHMTQPALSIQLKKFQSQFHHTLIEIIGKKVHVTELGQSIAEKAVELLTIANEINYLSNEYEGLHRGKLRIISVSTGKYVIPYFISDFLHLHPGIDINLDVSNKTDVVRSLKNNEVDFALVSISPPGLKINEEPLLENKLYLVGKNKKYDMNEPIIYREKGSSTRNLMNDYFSKGKSRKELN